MIVEVVQLVKKSFMSRKAQHSGLIAPGDGLLQAADAFDALDLGFDWGLGAAGRGEAVLDGRNRRTPAATIQEEKCMAKREGGLSIDPVGDRRSTASE